MRSSRWLFSLLAPLVLCPALLCQTQEESHVRIVRLSYVDGNVQRASADSFGYENATLNTPLVERDQIRTGQDGYAEIQFEDGSTIRMAPFSQITFSELARLSSGATVTTADLDQGEAEFRVTRHNDDGLFTIRTHQRVITLKHTSRFRVTSSNSQPLEVVVWKGEVSLQDPDTGKEVAVKKNETFQQDTLDAGRYDLQKDAQADDLDDWSSQREDYIGKYANAGYTGSPYQYGLADLNYYGQYYNLPGYGYCWRPTNVNLGWDPFMNGYWTYSPAFGYTWVSAYPWGWMPYRYGHWVFVNGYGWVWQPGNFGNWVRVPRIVNPPSGFRVPTPPAPGIRAGTTTPGATVPGAGVVGAGRGRGTFNIGGRGGNAGDENVQPPATGTVGTVGRPGDREHHGGNDDDRDVRNAPRPEPRREPPSEPMTPADTQPGAGVVGAPPARTERPMPPVHPAPMPMEHPRAEAPPARSTGPAPSAAPPPAPRPMPITPAPAPRSEPAPMRTAPPPAASRPEAPSHDRPR